MASAVAVHGTPATGISYAHLRALAERGQTAVSKLSKLKDVAERNMGVALETLEVSAVSLGLGVVRGRYGTVELLGLPLDLVAAIGLHTVGFWAGGKYQEDFHHVANGALGAFLNTLGAGVGAKMLQRKAQPQAGVPAASPAVTSGVFTPPHASYGALPRHAGTSEIVELANAAVDRVPRAA